MNAHSFDVATATGAVQSLADYDGKVMLIVNVASKCGLTPQYEGLESLQKEFGADGLQILGFPCNQFGGQEPGTSEEILDFCTTNFDVSFPIYSKIDVNGSDADPLYSYLCAEQPGDFGPGSGSLFDHVKVTIPEVIGTDQIKWNFTKFLVARDGEVITRFEPTVEPADMKADIQAALAK
jgi:glutathione peroxidase